MVTTGTGHISHLAHYPAKAHTGFKMLETEQLASLESQDSSPEAICASVAAVFKVRKTEVALLEVSGNVLKFLYPAELTKVGAIPLSSPAIFLPAAQASTEAATGTPAAASKPVPAKPDAQRAVTTRRRSASDDGLIAEDTVVFYNRKPSQPAQAKLPPPASGAKRYSDAD